MTLKHLLLSPDAAETASAEPVIETPAASEPSSTSSADSSSSEASSVSPSVSETKLKNFDISDDDLSDLRLDNDNVETPAPAPKSEKPKAAKVEPAAAKPARNSKLGDSIKPSTSTRDYTGFTPEEVNHLKQMSNTAFDFASKVLRERKELESLKSAQYLQNPEAYRLDPEYKRAEEDMYYLSQEAGYWQQQLMNIKAGKDWTPLLGWNKQGQPVFDKPRPATDADEEDVRVRMQQTQQMSSQSQMQIRQLQQGYNQRVQNDVAAIRSIQQQKFSWSADPKLLETNVNIEGLGDRSIKQIKDDFMSLLPAYHRSNVVSDVAADMFAALQIYAQEIRNLKAQLQTTEKRRSDALRAEPSGSARPKTTGVAKSRWGGPAVFDDLPPM